MAKGNIKSKKGFTIIEVVLVLAIAGLIFLMVFIALPALQRGQRNTQREDDLARVLTAVTDFQSNNSGRLPFTQKSGTTWEVDQNFVTRYIDDTCENTGGVYECEADQFRDPDGTEYSFAAGTVETDMSVKELEEFDHKMYYVVGYMCGTNEGTVIKGSGDRQVAIFMVLEGGGISCNANS